MTIPTLRYAAPERDIETVIPWRPPGCSAESAKLIPVGEIPVAFHSSSVPSRHPVRFAREGISISQLPQDQAPKPYRLRRKLLGLPPVKPAYPWRIPGTPSLSSTHSWHAGPGAPAPHSGHIVELREIHSSCKVRISHEFSIVRSEQILTVTSADFQRNLGLYQDEALKKPVAITKNGRPRTVLISAEEYARLKRRDRRVLEAGEVSERQIAALREAKVPDRFANLDAELKDWKP